MSCAFTVYRKSFDRLTETQTPVTCECDTDTLSGRICDLDLILLSGRYSTGVAETCPVARSNTYRTVPQDTARMYAGCAATPNAEAERGTERSRKTVL